MEKSRFFSKSKYLFLIWKRNQGLIPFLPAQNCLLSNQTILIFRGCVIYNHYEQNQHNRQEMKKESKINWTSEEETFLKVKKEKQGITSWTQIAKMLNESFPDKNRTDKQCRERYINFLQKQVEMSSENLWKQNEIQKIFQLFSKIGSKWVQIAKHMPNRSENSIKNKFYNSMKKLLRWINFFYGENSQQRKKGVTFETLIYLITLPVPESTVEMKSEGQIVSKLLIIEEVRDEIFALAERLNLIQNDKIMEEKPRLIGLAERIRKFTAENKKIFLKQYKQKKVINDTQDKNSRSSTKRQEQGGGSDYERRDASLEQIKPSRILRQNQEGAQKKQNPLRKMEDQELIEMFQIDQDDQLFWGSKDEQDLEKQYCEIVSKQYFPQKHDFFQ